MSHDESKILSYGDVLLRKGDLNNFEIGSWLNDVNIAFYFEYLNREIFPTLDPHTLLIPGATTYLLIAVGPSIASSILTPLSFEHRQLTLFAVNNNPDVSQANGGSHWSIAAYYSPTNTFHHYDSCSPSNSLAAKQLFYSLKPCLPDTATFIEEQAPQQQNNNDCGMYVLLISHALCSRMVESFQSNPLEMTMKITERDGIDADRIASSRKHIYSIIVQKSTTS